MIAYCDECGFFKERKDFDDYYEYENNICIACLDKEDETVDEGEGEEFNTFYDGDLEDLDLEDAPPMEFGETDEDYEDRLRHSVIFEDEEEQDIISDGEIEEEGL